MRKFINHHKWIEEAIKNIETDYNLWMDRRKQKKRLSLTDQIINKLLKKKIISLIKKVY